MDPKFHTRESLLKKLSLNEGNSNGLPAKVDQALLEAHTMFLDVFGEDFDGAGFSSENARGIIAEFKYVRAVLMDLLSVQFAGSSASDQEVWNEEGLNRDRRDRDKLISQLKIDARAQIQSLRDGIVVRSETVRVLETSDEMYKSAFDRHATHNGRVIF